METVKMIEVTRSGFVESAHRGVAVLINSNGEVLREWGNSNILIYPRSALKPIQSLNLYKNGVAEGLNLSDDFIALTTASHHAEYIHQKMIRKWLKKINLKKNIFPAYLVGHGILKINLMPTQNIKSKEKFFIIVLENIVVI